MTFSSAVKTQNAVVTSAVSCRFDSRVASFHVDVSRMNRSWLIADTQCCAMIQYVFEGLPSRPVIVRKQSFVFNSSSSSRGHAFKIVPTQQQA